MTHVLLLDQVAGWPEVTLSQVVVGTLYATVVKGGSPDDLGTNEWLVESLRLLVVDVLKWILIPTSSDVAHLALLEIGPALLNT